MYNFQPNYIENMSEKTKFDFLSFTNNFEIIELNSQKLIHNLILYRFNLGIQNIYKSYSNKMQKPLIGGRM